MLRRAGHFRGAKVAELAPQEQDTGDGLESKWRTWVQQESFKRWVPRHIPHAGIVTDTSLDWPSQCSTKMRDPPCPY